MMIYEYTYTLSGIVTDYFLQAVQIAIPVAVIIYFVGWGVSMIINMFIKVSK